VRWVDPERVENALPPDWYRKAREAASELDNASDEEARRVVLKSKASVWQAAKVVLKRVMEDKCWYCETPNPRSDNAVDHFRPKSRYWWLAFDVDNLRFSCTYCNSRRVDEEGGTSGGKQDEFPVAGDAAKASSDSLDAEEALLLDPCDYEDPGFLWFDDTGQPALNPAAIGMPNAETRLEESIRLYHLDFGPLTTQRRRRYLDVISACHTGDRCRSIYIANADAAAKKLWWERIAQVRRLIDPSSPYSAAARCAALGLRASSPTASRALEHM
jgi:uncharacterized protein (TIGR02646 family)